VPTAVSTRVLGDWNLSGGVTAADIPAMMTALTDLTTYKASHSLTSEDILNVGDVDLSGSIDNFDMQAELRLLGGGTGAATVPEPTTLMLLAIGLAMCSLKALKND
jgi:hypothetical protein